MGIKKKNPNAVALGSKGGKARAVRLSLKSYPLLAKRALKGGSGI